VFDPNNILNPQREIPAWSPISWPALDRGCSAIR